MSRQTARSVHICGSGPSRLPVWVDREGREEPIKGPSAQYLVPRIPPDGRRVAFHDIAGGSEYDVWILDLERTTAEKLTTGPGRDSEPILVARRDAYRGPSRPESLVGRHLHAARADGTGNIERLTQGTQLAAILVAQRMARRTSNSATAVSLQTPCPG